LNDTGFHNITHSDLSVLAQEIHFGLHKQQDNYSYVLMYCHVTCKLLMKVLFSLLLHLHV